MPSVHIITGGTGAGKTRHAMALAANLGVIRFSIDDWVAVLFWMDSPTPISHAWAMERIARCEAMIGSSANTILDRGIDIVLDLGFTKQAHRAAHAAKAQDAGANVMLNWIDSAANTRWANVEHRNAIREPSWAIDVDRAMFDFMEAEYEAPDADEMTTLMTSRLLVRT